MGKCGYFFSARQLSRFSPQVIFCNRKVKKSQRVSFQIFQHYETVKNSHFFRKFFKVSKGSLQFFDIFKNRMAVNKSQRAPLSQFTALQDFSKLVVFVLKLGFLSPSTLYPIFFKDRYFFYAIFL